MMKKSFLIGLLAVTLSLAQDEHVLRSELSPLQFLVGSCWSGTFTDNVRVDTHCYESLYDGMHVRDRHVVTGGPTIYRGETIYSWNAQDNVISYVYWTSSGGVSTGTLVKDGTRYLFPDESYEGPDGQKMLISSSWENITDESYDLLIKETVIGGAADETRMTFAKKSFRNLDAE